MKRRLPAPKTTDASAEGAHVSSSYTEQPRLPQIRGNQLFSEIILEEEDYKLMRLYDGDGSSSVYWYFEFSLKNPATGVLQRFRRSFDVNRIKNIKKRYRFANQLVKKFNNALIDGKVATHRFFTSTGDYSSQVSPIVGQMDTGSVIKVEESLIPLHTAPDVQPVDNDILSTDAGSPFTEQVPAAMLDEIVQECLETRFKRMQKVRKGKKKLPVNKRTKDTYELYIRRFTTYLHQKGLKRLNPREFTEVEAESFQDHMISELELSNKSINETMGFVKSIWKGVRKSHKVLGDAFEDIVGLTVDPSQKYKPFTEDEKKLIATVLRDKAPMMYLAAQFVYNCFARPQELCSLRRRDLNFSVSENEVPTVVITYNIGKVSRTSYREIPEGLCRLLKEMEVDKMRPDQLVFESICGRNPAPDLRRKKMTDLWKKLIIDGLGIDNNFYALKHTGNIDYILQNPRYNILWLQQQNGHSSLDMTEKYLRDLPIQKLRQSGGVVKLFGEVA